jgi:multiple sugar transport system ATP-binding protein
VSQVTLTDVKKIYPGNVTAVHRSNLAIEDREFMVLVGPSGCGKTTTLRMVAGLEEITEGTVKIGERVVNEVLPKDRNIAMVFQNYAIYPHMTVYDNLSFGLRQRKFPKAEIHKRVTEAAKVLGIDELLSRRPKALSGGQRQRVAVGRAIVRQPEVFLFDEPLSNLDAKMRVEMRKELKLLHQRLQTTIIYVTHDQIEAMTLGDRVCVMNEGYIEQVGPPIEIYDFPKTRFVAAFIGTPPMNFLPGELHSRDEELVFVGATFETKLPKELYEKLTPFVGRKVEMGIRPENFMAADDDVADELTVPGVVQIIEALGNELLVYIRVGEATVISRFEAHEKIGPGDEVRLIASPSKIHMFDNETNKNIIYGD